MKFQGSSCAVWVLHTLPILYLENEVLHLPLCKMLLSMYHGHLLTSSTTWKAKLFQSDGCQLPWSCAHITHIRALASVIFGSWLTLLCETVSWTSWPLCVKWYSEPTGPLFQSSSAYFLKLSSNSYEKPAGTLFTQEHVLFLKATWLSSCGNATHAACRNRNKTVC